MTIRTQTNKISKKDVQELRGQMLEWYDQNRRALPWRSDPGEYADPYHVWLSEIMLQQTTVGAVIPYYTKFLEKWPTIHDLAKADQEEVLKEWAGLGYYARARNLHKCAKVVSEELGGQFPSAQKDLLALPGIGDYTSAAIMTIAFNKPAAVMDGNIERVMARYFCVTEPLPKSKPVLKSLTKEVFQDFEDRPGDLAQSLMDLGAGVCIPNTNPRCLVCPISRGCLAFANQIAGELPKKEKKKPRPVKYGDVYWIQNTQGLVLIHRRAEQGLLGGMLGFPTSDWVDKKAHKSFEDLSILKIQDCQTQIRHVFTHFELRLDLKKAVLRSDEISKSGYEWKKMEELSSAGLPSLFEKVYKQFV